jgi:cation diffusion facilitator CzcD-associated flavoprotein CzcO
VDQISTQKVELTLEVMKTGDLYKETFNHVFNTSFGTMALPVPLYPGTDTFTGPILTSHQVSAEAIQRMQESGETVTVLGGSKAAVDMLNLLLLYNAGVKTH